MDFKTQRRNMVESQVRPSDVTDRRIVRAMLDVPREAFVPPAMRALAYMDAEVRIAPAGPGHSGRALLAPRTFAKLIQLAEIETSDVVLDIGAATAYSAAVIAKIAGTVVALECDHRLAEDARRSLASLSLDSVAVVTGDLAGGHPPDGPYDVIVLEGAVAEVPEILLEQLKDRGRLVGILAPPLAQGGALGKAVVWRRHDGIFSETGAFDAHAPVLPGFEKAPEFTF